MLARDQLGPILGRYAVALRPRPDGVNGRPGQDRQSLRPDRFDNFMMASHSPVMHYAFSQRKRQMHNEVHYAWRMNGPEERLRIARIRAGFDTGKAAAEAMGVPVATYLGHENGSRGISAKRAGQYAKRFKVTEQWILYGVGPAPGSEQQGETAEIINLIDHMPPLRRKEALNILRVLAGNGDS